MIIEKIETEYIIQISTTPFVLGDYDNCGAAARIFALTNYGKIFYKQIGDTTWSRMAPPIFDKVSNDE